MSVRRVVPDFQADDPAGSGAFYADVLGLEPVMDLGSIVTFAALGSPAAQISVMREDATASVVPDASTLIDEPWASAASLFATLPARCSTS
jgi:catechol 2,3-dioxygenase-like lactoylglutathione lyase family enzyme